MRRSKWPAIPDAAGGGGEADTTVDDNFASVNEVLTAVIVAAAPPAQTLTNNTGGTVITDVPAFSATYTVAELNNFAATVIGALNGLRATLTGVSALVPLTDNTGGTSGSTLEAVPGGGGDVASTVNAILTTMRENGMIEKPVAVAEE